MEAVRNWTVQEVRELFNATLVDTFAATSEGQMHLNRIAKSITNESLDKRLTTQRQTLAEAAFNKELGKVASKTPERVADFMAGKATWIARYIDRKYGEAEA